MRPATIARSAALSAALLLTAAGSHALPSLGQVLPNVHLEDADGNGAELAQLMGRPLLFLYEDRAGSSQNKPLKDELRAFAQSESYRKSVAVVAVAGLSGYDFWPARGFARSSVRSESERSNIPIYCDWSGAVLRAFGFVEGQSNVLLLDRTGHVVFRQSGALDLARREELFRQIQTEIARRP